MPKPASTHLEMAASESSESKPRRYAICCLKNTTKIAKTKSHLLTEEHQKDCRNTKQRLKGKPWGRERDRLSLSLSQTACDSGPGFLLCCRLTHSQGTCT